MTKLNDTTLENVNGGLVLADTEGLIVKYVVDDATGKLLDMALSVGQAMDLAAKRGLSTECISLAEYRRRYGYAAEL